MRMPVPSLRMNLLLPTTLANRLDVASMSLDLRSTEACACLPTLTEIPLADAGDVEHELRPDFVQYLSVMSDRTATPAVVTELGVADEPVEDGSSDQLPNSLTPDATQFGIAELKQATRGESQRRTSVERLASSTSQLLVPQTSDPPSVTPPVGPVVKLVGSTPHDLTQHPDIVSSSAQQTAQGDELPHQIDRLRNFTNAAESPKVVQFVSNGGPSSVDRPLIDVPLQQPTSVLGRRATAATALDETKPAELVETHSEPVNARASRPIGETQSAPIVVRPLVTATGNVPIRLDQVSEKLRHEVDAAHPSLGRTVAVGTPTGPVHEPVTEPLVEQVAARIIQLAESTDRTTTRLEVELDPPDLGSIRVELSETSEGIRARIQASRESTVILVDYQMATLRQTLVDAGVDINELQVSHESVGQEAESNRREEGWRDAKERTSGHQVEPDVDSETPQPPPRRRDVIRGLVDLQV